MIVPGRPRPARPDPPIREDSGLISTRVRRPIPAVISSGKRSREDSEPEPAKKAKTINILDGITLLAKEIKTTQEIVSST